MRVSLNFARSQLGYQYVVHELHHDVKSAEYDGMVCQHNIVLLVLLSFLFRHLGLTWLFITSTLS